MLYRPFFNHFANMNLYKMNLPIFLASVRRQEKSPTYCDLSGFKMEFESFKSVMHFWCDEFSKVKRFSSSSGGCEKTILVPVYIALFFQLLSLLLNFSSTVDPPL